jgi:hypothetical protein
MIALFGEKKETDYGYLLQANVIETDMCLLVRTKKDIFWVQIVKYENLCKG